MGSSPGRSAPPTGRARPRPTRHFLLLAVAAVAAVAGPGSARATTQLFDPASFGTGVYVGASVSPSIGKTTPFHSSSDEVVFATIPPEGVEAHARADFQSFSVGANAVSFGGDISGGAIAYTGFTVSSSAPLTLSGSVTLEGGFFSSSNGDFLTVPNDDNAEVDLFVWDIHGDPLAEAVLEGAGLGSSYVLQCLDATCFSHTFSYQSSTLWTSGSIQVPYTVSLGADNGVIVEIWARAKNGGPRTSSRRPISFIPPLSASTRPRA